MATQSYYFRSDPVEISRICTRVETFLIQKGYETDLRDRAHIVLAEILNNVSEHAYEGRVDGQIALEIQADKDCLRITVKDEGRAFPGPPNKTFSDLSQTELSELPEGGFGWALIQALTTKITYNYVDRHNILQVLLQSDEKPSKQ